MSVQYKFRSSTTYDTININGQPSITLRDLKSQILNKTRLINNDHNFDLLFSDSLSGLEYKDDSVRIPSGACLIIKRVPSARCSEEQLLRFDKLEAAHSCQSTRKGSSANEGSILLNQPKEKMEELPNLERRLCSGNQLVLDRSDGISELKCSLCRNFFKDAVLIPCCQRSFCDECIRLSLSEFARCPMCSSTKCKAEDLLPNISLRQATGRFVESQVLCNPSGKDLDSDAPDCESGIQAEGCPDTYKKSKTICGKGHVLAEDSTESEGENYPQSVVRRDEQGFERDGITPGSFTKGHQTCYMCGSPDHLIRECPAALRSHANHWNGDAFGVGAYPSCAPSYWPGSPPYVSPYFNLYGGSGMVMYNNPVAPVPTFVYPSYAPSFYGAYPVASDQMQLGCMTRPIVNNAPHASDVYLHGHDSIWRGNYIGDLASDQICFQQQNVSILNDHVERRANYSNNGLGRRSVGRSRSINHSDEDSFSNCGRHERTSHPNHRRYRRNSPSDRSISERDLSDSRIDNREDRHVKHHKSSQRNERKGAEYSSSRGKSTNRRKMEHDERTSYREYQCHSVSFEANYSSDRPRRRPEETMLKAYPKRNAKPNDKALHGGREKLAKYYDDNGEYHHCHKRKRYH